MLFPLKEFSLYTNYLYHQYFHKYLPTVYYFRTVIMDITNTTSKPLNVAMTTFNSLLYLWIVLGGALLLVVH